MASAVRDLLRAALVRGAYDGRALPDEAALQRTHAVSRGAVRSALEMLSAEGLVERTRGAGTFVAAYKTVHRAEGLRGLQRTWGPVRHEVVLRRSVGAHGVLVDLLRVPAGSAILRLDRRTTIGSEVVGLWTSYLPLHLAEPLATAGSDLSGDYYDALERLLGCTLGEAELTTEAVVADPVVARSLRIPVGSAVLRLERILRFADGRPLEFAVGRFRGDRLTLSSTSRR